MKISSVQGNASFGRALTTAEKKNYVKLQEQARQQLGLDKTTATVFDFFQTYLFQVFLVY